jgi:hypothetical protein
MSREPYKSARRVFWIMDNCSAHRGQRAVDRLRSQWPNLLLVHTPVHASWLNRCSTFSKRRRIKLAPSDNRSTKSAYGRVATEAAWLDGNNLEKEEIKKKKEKMKEKV